MLFSIPKVLSLATLASGVFASPLAATRRSSSNSIILNSGLSNVISFNNWGGLSSLNGFDNFFGSGNFNGFSNQQVILVNQAPVCQASQILLIQQQLAIMQEFAKQLILTQLCDVESQILVLDQFNSGFSNFGLDLSRISGRNIGFDSGIAALISQLVLSNGGINLKDFGFLGSNIGQQFIVPSGSNWNDNTSPQSVEDLKKQIELASNSTVVESSGSEPQDGVDSSSENPNPSSD